MSEQDRRTFLKRAARAVPGAAIEQLAERVLQ